MKARTPITANKTLLDGQLHSSGAKMVHLQSLIKYRSKTFTDPGRYTALTILLRLMTKTSDWLGTKET